MAEYIEREALIKRLRKVHMEKHHFAAGVQFGVEHAIKCTEEAKAENVAPVVRGKWEHVKTICGSEFVMCSKCGYKEHDHVKYTRFNYCPNCGARMEG